MWGNELDAYWLFQIDLCKETKLSQKLPFCYWRFYFCLHKCKFQLFGLTLKKRNSSNPQAFVRYRRYRAHKVTACVSCWQGEIQEMMHTRVHGLIDTHCRNKLIGFQIIKHVNIKKQVMRGMGSTSNGKVRETLSKELTLWPEISVMRRSQPQFPHKGSEEREGWPSRWWERVMGLQDQKHRPVPNLN